MIWAFILHCLHGPWTFDAHLLVSVDTQEVDALWAHKRRTPCSGIIAHTWTTSWLNPIIPHNLFLVARPNRALNWPGLSTLMTSAPRSPRIMVANGPARTLWTDQIREPSCSSRDEETHQPHSHLVRSSTLMPSSGRTVSPAEDHKGLKGTHSFSSKLCVGLQ